MVKINDLARPEIVALKPYSSARSLSKAQGILLDANENPYPPEEIEEIAANRYPDPFSAHVRQALSEYCGVPAENITIGNGSDDLIDLVIKIFCRNGDNIVAPAPTYPMYEVAAEILGVECVKPLLNEDFTINEPAILAAITPRTKAIFLCTPNNPVGTVIPNEQVARLAERTRLPIIVDEAYFEYGGSTAAQLAVTHENVIVLRTMSKAWGLAGLRLGYAIASVPAIALFDKVKAPYNVSSITQKLALKALANVSRMRRNVAEAVAEREKLARELAAMGFAPFPSSANFITARVPAGHSAPQVYMALRAKGIIARDRSTLPRLSNSIRFSIGTPAENAALTKALKEVLA